MYKALVSGACLAFLTACPLSAQTEPVAPPAAGMDAMRLQVVLDRLGFTPGVIDGKEGASLTWAIKGFQRAGDMPETGKPDAKTLAALQPYATLPAVIDVKLDASDFAGPFVGPIPKGAKGQAALPAMGYADPLEGIAERYHTTKATLVALNGPDARVAEGATIKVPNVRPAATDYPATLREDWRATLAHLSVSSDQPKAAKVVVDKSDGVLRVYDAADKLVAQFPATMGSQHDPLPIGTWKIQGTSYLPRYHYNPALFWDAKKGDEKQMLKPGPNGPVGVVWMDLNKAHYGIHGTPSPETIGRAESHGCVRLTNWDAARLAMMVKPGIPAIFQR